MQPLKSSKTHKDLTSFLGNDHFVEAKQPFLEASNYKKGGPTAPFSEIKEAKTIVKSNNFNTLN